MKKKIEVIIGCECSGEVRRAFNTNPLITAYSCDLQPADDGETSLHLIGDLKAIINSRQWDLGIFHPPCTYLANSGVHHLYNEDNSFNWERYSDLQKGIEFFNYCLSLPIPSVCVENPIMHKWAKDLSICREPTQLIQPYMFGHTESKATCLWLKHLPKLQPTNVLPYYDQSCWKEPPSELRAKIRSKTYPGIAKAMAEQWGYYLISKQLGIN